MGFLFKIKALFVSQCHILFWEYIITVFIYTYILIYPSLLGLASYSLDSKGHSFVHACSHDPSSIPLNFFLSQVLITRDPFPPSLFSNLSFSLSSLHIPGTFLGTYIHVLNGFWMLLHNVLSPDTQIHTHSQSLRAPHAHNAYRVCVGFLDSDLGDPVV